MMYRTGLVPRATGDARPRRRPAASSCPAPPSCSDVIEVGSPGRSLAAVPEFFWELSFGVYLIVKGFKPSPITAGHGGRPMITVENVTKTYGAFTAVDDVSFTADLDASPASSAPTGPGSRPPCASSSASPAPTHGTAHVLGRRFADLPNPGLEVGVPARRVRPARRPHRPGGAHHRAQDHGAARDPGRGDARAGRPHRR